MTTARPDRSTGGPDGRTDPPRAEDPRPPRRYRGLDPEQRRADRRRRLLDAGLELFGTVGYQATTITGLCRAAGVTTAHFYEEFGGREPLLWAVFDDLVSATADRVATAMAGAPATLRAQARAGLGAFLHDLLDDPRRGRVQCLETVGVSPGFEARRRELLRAYAAVVARAAQEAASVDDERTRTTRFVPSALVAGVNDAVIEWLLLDDPPPIDAVADELVELFVLVGEHYRDPAGGTVDPG